MARTNVGSHNCGAPIGLSPTGAELQAPGPIQGPRKSRTRAIGCVILTETKAQVDVCSEGECLCHEGPSATGRCWATMGADLDFLSNQLHQGSRAWNETRLRGVKPQFREPVGPICSGSLGQSLAGVVTPPWCSRQFACRQLSPRYCGAYPVIGGSARSHVARTFWGTH